MDRYYDPPQLHASSWARFWFVADWEVPMVYLLYVLLAIVGTVIVIIRMF
jgi:hypothetical protein